MNRFSHDFSYCSDQPEWGCGAAGSAREWHSRGRGFNPRQLHQTALRAYRRTIGAQIGFSLWPTDKIEGSFGKKV